jgi:predicted outer membrane repeat protein
MTDAPSKFDRCTPHSHTATRRNSLAISLAAACAAATFLAQTTQAQVVLFVRPQAPDGGDGGSWNTAFRDLQPALDAAAPLAAAGAAVQIWLTAGTYHPSVQTDPDEPASVTFQLINNVSIFGGFAGAETFLYERDFSVNTTILSGSHSAWHVVTAVANDATAVLDGVVIADGQGGDGFTPGSENGAGMLILDASPTVANCLFRDNRVTVLNAVGAAVYNQEGAPRFTACTFSDNQSDAGDAGAFATIGGAPALFGCTFNSNTATFGGGALSGDGYLAERCTFFNNLAEGGGALYGSGTFRQCTFRANAAMQSGGAAYNADGSLFVLCNFIDNMTSFDGGAISASADIGLANCLFLRNMTTASGSAASCSGRAVNCVFNSNFGGAALFVFDPSQVINCTFVRNVGGGLESVSASSVDIANSIFWNNSRGGVADEEAQISGPQTALNVNFNFIQGLTGALGGQGNIGQQPHPEPEFTDLDGPDDVPGTADDDFTLAPGSPCIDSASTPALLPDFADIDADSDTAEVLPLDAALLPRRADDPDSPDVGLGPAPIVDMGAFEFQALPACRADWNSDATVNSSDFFDFMNDFFASQADFNRDGVTNVNDFFDFLIAFFAGCP